MPWDTLKDHLRLLMCLAVSLSNECFGWKSTRSEKSELVECRIFSTEVETLRKGESRHVKMSITRR